MESIQTTFVGGDSGPWKIISMQAVKGQPLPQTGRLSLREGLLHPAPPSSLWCLRGVTSYPRYVHQQEQARLAALQPPLGRPEATCARLIPISKSAAWWDLAQDERRAILEEQSAHISEGLKYLPAVARRLYHGRELGEPFDFLTWFEFAPGDQGRFEELLGFLRASREWAFVEREVDIRLEKA